VVNAGLVGMTWGFVADKNVHGTGQSRRAG